MFCLAFVKLPAQAISESKRNICLINHERIECSPYPFSKTSNVVFNELDGNLANGPEAVFLSTSAQKLFIAQNANTFTTPSFPSTNSFQMIHYNPLNTKGNVITGHFNGDAKPDYAYINSYGNVYSFLNTTTTSAGPYTFQKDSFFNTLGPVGPLLLESKLIPINLNNLLYQDFVSVGVTGTGFKEFKFAPYQSTSTGGFLPATSTVLIVGAPPSSVAVSDNFDAVAADIGGDARDELFFVSEYSQDSLYVFLSLSGNLDYKVQPIKTTTLTGVTFKKINVADVNGDGKKEIAVLARTPDGQYWIYIHTPNLVANVFSVSPFPDALIPLGNEEASDFKFVDLDKDGLKDVVVNKISSGQIKIYMQTKAIGINYDVLLPRIFNINNHAGTHLAIADVDLNQREDIISYSAINNNATIAILKNLTYRDTLVSAPSKTFICPGETIKLVNQLIGFAGSYTSNIVSSASLTTGPNPSHTLALTGAYNNSVTSIYGFSNTPYSCTVASNPIQVTQRNLPNLVVTAPPKLCYENDGEIIVSGANTYTWLSGGSSNNDTLLITSPTSSVLYSVAGTSLGCTKILSGTVQVNPKITATIIPDKNLLCKKQTASLTAMGGVGFYWEPSQETIQSIVVTQTSTAAQGYTAIVYDADGCSAKADFQTQFNDKCNEVTVTTGITPNNDGKNDYLYIENIENFPNNKVSVFNRWGVQLYGPLFYDNSNKAWPQKSFDLLPGTYYVVVDLGNGDEIKKEWIEILSN